jgi:orotate phosphoribosyltransferase
VLRPAVNRLLTRLLQENTENTLSDEALVMDILRQTGAVRDGHFLLASGLHSPTYVEKFQVLQWPEQTGRLCGMIADRFRNEGIQVVAGPTTGGVIIAYETGRQLGVRAIFAEREGAGKDETRRFRRGFTIAPGEKVLIVDDITTTGGSLQAMLDEVARHQGQVVAVAVLVLRAARPVELGVPIYPLLRLDIPAYDPAACPLCAQNIPIVKPGSSSPQPS